MKRPLVPVALLYVGGILIARFISLPPLLLLAGSLSLAALTLAWPRARLVGLCTLIVLTGWTNHTLRTAILSPHDLRRILGEQPEIVTVRGTLRETPTQRVYERDQQESWRTMARVDVTALRLNRQSWQPAAGRMAVTTQGILSTNFFAGQEVEITGVAGRPKIAAAEGTFDYRAYLKRTGDILPVAGGFRAGLASCLFPVDAAAGGSVSRVGAPGAGARIAGRRRVAAPGMGAHAGVENRPHRGSLRTVRSGRHLSYLRRGRAAHGDHLRHLLLLVSRAASAPRACAGWC